MKKILLAVTAALAITGCSQNEEFDNAAQNAEINIGTVVKATSRATVTDNKNFEAFKVSSFIVAAGADFTTTPLGTPYMNGIKYTGLQGNWTQEGSTKFYWPSGKNVQFFGYPDGLTLTTPAVDVAGYPTIDFTIETTSNAQTDLVVASVNTPKPSDSNNVTLDFKHILAKINFSYKPEDTNCNYDIKGIKITGVKGGKATYTFAADVAKGTWSDGAAVADGYTYPLSINATADSEGYYALGGDNASLMLLPQAVTGAIISIEYKTTQKDNENVIFFEGTKTVTLPADSNWGIGSSIRYKLTLPVGADQVGVATSVEKWGDDSSVKPTIDENK